MLFPAALPLLGALFSLLPPAASQTACTPGGPPYTQHPYDVTGYYQTNPSQRPPFDGLAFFVFNLSDPNTCLDARCEYQWNVGPDSGDPSPYDTYVPCNANAPYDLQFTFRPRVLTVKYKFTAADENGQDKDYSLVGNGTLWYTGHCSSSGVCRWGWNQVPSSLAVVDESAWPGQ